MQQEDFIRAQSAQAQVDQGQQAQQQNPNMQNQYIQDPNSQQQYTQNPPMQNPNMQNQYVQDPNAQNQEGDFYHGGHRYNIHALHQLMDSQHPNSTPPSNRGSEAFALPSHGAYGPHNAPARPAPRLGPNGRPMIKMEHFGYKREWVETPDPQAYRREDEVGRAEREQDMAAQLEFIERNPHRLGPTWRPSWRGNGGPGGW